MKNIERKYAYYDEGDLPVTGEDGVTYLTLYSSEAGNTYDGWIWDPDRIHSSETERTFGYRYPGDENYCWDDEVIVDLSNAQNRQEASEYETGRITSYNTNVSDRPIVLNDVDILGLTEEERESKATTVLFTAIPLIKSAYIHAEIEISMKMNISPDNTNGNVRVEAFYILNNDSDRVMRPNPVNHYTVTKVDEYHTMRLMYWNPAVSSDNHNYIGVKLLVTGGTAEIGISSNPAYGDAIITVASNGMTGDNIDSGKPRYLSISGKEYVVPGYKLKERDYTVICTYDTGEVYDVTRVCTFSPVMGTEIQDEVTVLTAMYSDLRASMAIRLGDIDHIELFGLKDLYGTYVLDSDDYLVMGYLDNGDSMEITDDCTFSPAIGTTINSNTTLTATYEPFWVPGTSYSDSLQLIYHGEPLISESPNNGLVYKLFSDHHITITGNSHIVENNKEYWETVQVPPTIAFKNMMDSHEEYSIEWAATGYVGGVKIGGFDTSFLKDFDKITIVSPYISGTGVTDVINMAFTNNATITSDELEFFKNIDYTKRASGKQVKFGTISFRGCSSLTHSDFLSNVVFNYVTSASQQNDISMEFMFYECTNLVDVSGIKDWDMSLVKRVTHMFSKCTSLSDVSVLSGWRLYNVESGVDSMFTDSGLTSLNGLNDWDVGKEKYIRTGSKTGINFSGTKLTNLEGIDKWFGNDSVISYVTFQDIDTLTTLEGSENWNVSSIDGFSFKDCINLEDISAMANWRITGNFTAVEAFANCSKLSNLNILNSLPMENCTNVVKMLSVSNPSDFYQASGTVYIGDLSLDKIFGELTSSGRIQYIGAYGVGEPCTTMYGMFRGRDLWRWTKSDSSVNIDGMEFEYPSCIPLWYKEMLENNFFGS